MNHPLTKSTPLARLAAYKVEAVGLLAWLAVVALGRLALAESILLWAAFVPVPLTLRLLTASPASHAKPPRAKTSPWLALACRGQLPAALLLASAFCLPAGPLAALLTGPWLVVAALVAAAGFFRALQLWHHPLANAPELSLSIGMMFLLIGASWTFLSRGGWRPLEFDDTIVLLTGVHFHYAGLMLPTLAGLAAREAHYGLSRAGIAAILIGVPGVGVGITFSPAVEVASALLLVAGCLWLVGAQLRLALTAGQPTRLLLWSVSALSLLGGMSLAAVYALGEFSGDRWLTIPTMIPLHGVTQAFGFATCGLLAWAFSREKS